MHHTVRDLWLFQKQKEKATPAHTRHCIEHCAGTAAIELAERNFLEWVAQAVQPGVVYQLLPTAFGWAIYLSKRPSWNVANSSMALSVMLEAQVLHTQDAIPASLIRFHAICIF